MPLRVTDDSNADPTLRGLLDSAVKALNNIKAYESLYIHASVDISVSVEKGFHGFICRPTRIDQGDFPFKFKPSQIILGSDVLTSSGNVGRLVALGSPPEDAMLCCLAHELTHVDESQRLSSQGVTHFEANSRFCWAIRPSLSKEHNELLRSCARKYQGAYSRDTSSRFQLMPVDVARAQDIASELCADLLALHWMKMTKGNITATQNALLRLRLDDEKSLLEYQTGQAMTNLLKQNLNSHDLIVQATASLCTTTLATGTNIDPNIQHDALALSAKGMPLPLTHGSSYIQNLVAKPNLSSTLAQQTTRASQAMKKAVSDFNKKP